MEKVRCTPLVVLNLYNFIVKLSDLSTVSLDDIINLVLLTVQSMDLNDSRY
jgi:hypothetical protein